MASLRRVSSALLVACLLILASVRTYAVIAYVASSATDLNNNGGGTSTYTTGNYTIASGSNLMLAVCLAADTTADNITAVKWRGSSGTALTLAKKETTSGGSSRNIYLYYLLSPTPATDTIYVSASTNQYLIVVAAVYTGVSGTGQPDSTASAVWSGSGNLTTTFTTVADNAWTILCGNSYKANQAETAISNATFRVADGFGASNLFDSGGAITPAGSFSMVTDNLADTGHSAGASFSPFAATPSVTCTRTLLGVGPC